MTVMHSSLEPNWRTPPACFAALDREFHFNLDAAANAQDHLCNVWYGPGGLAENALTASWRYSGGLTTVFVNPPFSRSLAAELKRQGDPNFESYRIENWMAKCWTESKAGCTVVGIIPFAPQTDWYRRFVYGHDTALNYDSGMWTGHAALQERRLPHRISFLTPDGEESNNAGVNSVIVVWGPATGIVGPWQPWSCYWSYR